MMTNSTPQTVHFNPFDSAKKMNWNIWTPGVTKLNHLDLDTSWCLMLDRKTGLTYMKEAADVSILEWNQMAGEHSVMAVAAESECFA